MVHRSTISLTLCPREGDPDNLAGYKAINTGILIDVMFFTGSYSDGFS